MWSPELKAASPFKKYGHRALDDIKESIMELQYYKDTLWKDVK
jgi:oligoribonuclease